ncbi:protein phosphatase 2C domain-containing protein [Candidatus Poribacteria bacterium]|nr:protein phosphatase 2C domain-containing protein [Candidatus Poribacteria bacterium]
MIKLTVKSFITPKKGETTADCQDARKHNESVGRYAVADGATLSFFPRQWAKLLVKRFCYPDGLSLSFEEENWEAWIEPIQQEWLEWVSQTVQETKAYMLVDRLSKLESALSTFIGIEFNVDKGEWKALIIGDSCLFHQNDSEFKSYLLDGLSDFQYRPKSFASFEKDNPVGGPPEVKSDKALPGDLFILATDALAKWIVQHKETGKDTLEKALDQLKQIETNDQFNQFVNIARDQEDIRLVNDDVTLMLISVEESQSPEVEDIQPEVYPETLISEDIQSVSNTLSFLFWLILAGVFGFFVGFIILVLILLNKN